MCVDAHVARCPSQTLVLPVGDVFFGLGVYVLFGQTKVDDVDGVLPLASRPSYQEVFRLHISVYQTLGVHIFHPCYLDKQDTNHDYHMDISITWNWEYRKNQANIFKHVIITTLISTTAKLNQLSVKYETTNTIQLCFAYQLYGYHEDGLEGKGAVTKIKQVL